MLQLLNTTVPTEIDARGFIAPYIRVSMHLGFHVAWIMQTTDEDWANPDVDSNDIRAQVIDDLSETREHLAINDDLSASAFVNPDMAARMQTLRQQVSHLVTHLPETRVDALIEIQTLAGNVAFVGAEFERHVTGSTIASEGRHA